MGIKTKNRKIIECFDWDKLVSETYGIPYCLQQQDGCQGRGNVTLTIPDTDNDSEMHDKIPEVINNEYEMGVKFDVWLERDPKAPLNPTNKEFKACHYYWGKTEKDKIKWKQDESHISMFYERNFYPDLQTVANDLHKKGLIEAGEYSIEIDW